MDYSQSLNNNDSSPTNTRGTNNEFENASTYNSAAPHQQGQTSDNEEDDHSTSLIMDNLNTPNVSSNNTSNALSSVLQPHLKQMTLNDNTSDDNVL